LGLIVLLGTIATVVCDTTWENHIRNKGFAIYLRLFSFCSVEEKFSPWLKALFSGKKCGLGRLSGEESRIVHEK